MNATGYADRSWAKSFYGSQAWKNCRREFAKSRAYLCERCAKRGLIVPGTEVHHKTPITPSNINDTSVTLNWDNLELLCAACHNAQHTSHGGRFAIDADGELIIKGE